MAAGPIVSGMPIGHDADARLEIVICFARGTLPKITEYEVRDSQDQQNQPPPTRRSFTVIPIVWKITSPAKRISMATQNAVDDA